MGVDETFAYESFRPGQRDLALQVNRSALAGEVLLAEAMSGFGKTAAVISGALSAAEETGCRVVYACRTKRQILRVVDELSRLQKKRGFAAASVLSKFDYCLLKRQSPVRVPQESFGWYCGFNVQNNLCTYFLNLALLRDELDRLVWDTANRIPIHTALLARSESAHVCPYEVVRLALAKAEFVVVPYQYVFDQRSTPVLFDKSVFDRQKTVLVVDEAHNLRDFLRSARSSTVTLDQIDAAIAEAESLLMDAAASSLKGLKAIVESTMKEAVGWRLSKDRFVSLARQEYGDVWLQNLAFELSACSEPAWGAVTYQRRMPSSILRVGDFLTRLSSADRTVLGTWERTLGLIDPNPVQDLQGYLARFRSAILVSATISPSAVFARSLGIDSRKSAVYQVQSEPFITVRTVIDTGVTTKYKSRTPQMYSKIADKVAPVIEATQNGVGVFAPSYSVLEPIYELVSKRVRGRHMVSEARGLSSQEAANIFDSLGSERGSVLFAVQGGRFSEGEDFVGDLMDAVVVIGLSPPPPSPMLYAEYACLKREGEPDSYLMLSRLPAARRAFQAAGRHIRSPGKRALVFLLDHRFDSDSVKELMPTWLKRDIVSGDFAPGQMRGITEDFWSSSEGRTPRLS